MSTATGKLDKVLDRIEQKISESDYYEAHQATRTVVARYVRTKKYSEAVHVLLHTSELLAKAGESSSACDLILYLVEVYRKGNYTPNAETRGQLIQLVNLLDAGKEPLVKKIANESISWSSTFEGSTTPLGDPELHHVFGIKFAQETTDTYEAERHLLLGTRESPKALASLLFKWATEPGISTDSVKKTSTIGGSSGTSSTDQSLELLHETPEELASNLPLYLSRGTLGYLSSGNIRDSRTVTQEFIRIAIAADIAALRSFLKHEITNEGDYQIYVFESIPLLNFLQLLIPTCQTKSTQFYQRLRARYSSLIDHIDAWSPVLGAIALAYFGIQPPRSQSNMLQDLLGSFMGGGGLGGR